MKIAVFELDYHFADLYNFCKLFQGTTHEITVFTKVDINERFSGDKISSSFRWVIKDQEALSVFLERNLTLINSHDLIFFITIASGYRAIFKTRFLIPTILRIHNSHSYLRPKSYIHIPKSFFNIYKSISYIFREMILSRDFYYIPKLIEKFNFVCFPDYFVENYVIEKNLIRKEKIFPCLPSASCFSIDNQIDVLKLALDICILGAIDRRKRDYILVVNAIKDALPNLKNPIRLTLLGKPIGKYGRKVIRQFKELECDNFQLVSFEQFVSQEEFNHILEKTDMILAPMIEESSFRIYTEIYGKSKTSGSFLDLVRFGKMVSLPVFFYTDFSLTGLIDKYESFQKLAEILVKYTNNRKSLLRRSQNLKFFLIQHYSPKKILNEFENNCHLLLLKSNMFK